MDKPNYVVVIAQILRVLEIRFYRMHSGTILKVELDLVQLDGSYTNSSISNSLNYSSLSFFNDLIAPLFDFDVNLGDLACKITTQTIKSALNAELYQSSHALVQILDPGLFIP